MENFVKFMTIVLTLTITQFINGFVIMKLWAWFIVPTFGVVQLGLVEAIGLMLVVNFFKPINSSKKDDTEEFWEKFLKGLGLLLFKAGFVLFVGWIVSLFM
jgi:hypothetical protein